MSRIPRPLGARVLMGTAAVLVLAAGLHAGPAGATSHDAGRVYAFGQARDHGSAGDALIGVASIPTGTGYWTVTESGTVRHHGDAPALGSATRGGVIDIAAAHTGRGYWLAFGDGAVQAFGASADHVGSMAGKPLNAPVVGMAATPSGKGYWLVASDGGIFAFGDAAYLGSMGGKPLNSPIVGIAATPTGKGYWMAAADGGVFSFGDARYRGSVATGSVTAVASAPRGLGYWLVATNGVVHAFGDAPDLGDLSTTAEVADLTPRPQHDGYWIATGPMRATTPTYRAANGDPPDSDFDRLAQCESSGNWAARGNGYEGGLQFMNSTWLGYGGGEFAAHAYDASREQQIEVGRRLWRERGWEPWPHCSRAVGLR